MSGPSGTSFVRKTLSRRTLLAGAAGAGALLATGCGSGSGGGGGGEGGGPVSLRMAWYGGEARTKKYGAILDSYQAAHPTVTVKRETAEWDKYWERVATQTAARDLPDVLHFTNMQLREFASNGQLLELSEENTKGGLDLSTLDPALLEAGKVDGKLYSIPTGSLILSSVANLGLLKGTGVTLPDAGGEWTWDDFREQGRSAVAKLGSGTWFVLDFGSSTRILTAFMMSRGKTLFNTSQQPPTVGFERQDLVDWLAYWEGLRQDGIAPPPSVTAEQQGLPFEADLFAKEKAAVYLHTSNTLTNYQKYTKGELVLRRLPHAVGGSSAVDYFFSVSMAVPASSKNPVEAAKVISYFLNDPAAVKTYGGEFGPPGSAAGRDILRQAAQADGQKVIDFTDSEIKLGAVADQNWPRGGQQLNDVVLGQANDQVAFGKASPEAAADEALVKLKDALSR